MKTQFLFPHSLKKWGWVILSPSFTLGILLLFQEFILPTETVYPFPVWIDDFVDEIALIGTLIGLVLIGFSKLKIEDEYVQKIRLDSLLWATYLNIGLIIMSTLMVYSDGYFKVMIYNLFALPLFFVIRFHLFLARR
jgi:hypothetical protein